MTLGISLLGVRQSSLVSWEECVLIFIQITSFSLFIIWNDNTRSLLDLGSKILIVLSFRFCLCNIQLWPNCLIPFILDILLSLLNALSSVCLVLFFRKSRRRCVYFFVETIGIRTNPVHLWSKISLIVRVYIWSCI